MKTIKNTLLKLAGHIAASVQGRMMLNAVLRLKGSAGRNSKNHSNTGNALRIFNYHRVLPGQSDFAIDAVDVKVFEHQISILSTYFNILPLESAVYNLHNGRLAPDSVCLTFDDGYKDNYEYAWPILKKHHAPATIFLATDFIGTNRFVWHDKVLWAFDSTQQSTFSCTPLQMDNVLIQDRTSRKKTAIRVLEKLKALTPDMRDEQIRNIYLALKIESLPARSNMLDWDEIKQMNNDGISFGAHTKSHPILSTLSDEALYDEIYGSKSIIEKYLNSPVLTFAYPNGQPGDYDDRAKFMLSEAGFQCAVTTCRGLNKQSRDLFELLRVSPWETDPSRFHGRLFLEQLLAKS